MLYLLAAAGAYVAALLELTLVPHLEVAGAHPHLVLLATVVGTFAFGFEAGVTLAVAGGLALDILASRPLGSSVFVLLIVAGGVSAAAGAFSPIRLVAPIVLTIVASPIFSLALMAVLSVSEGRPWPDDPIGLVLPGMIYDGVLAIVVGPLVVAARARAQESERFEW